MRNLSIIFFVLLSTEFFGQDLTDAKSIPLLKNIQCVNSNKQKDEYSAILKDNSLLSVKYKIDVDGEYNASYFFINTPSNFSFENTSMSNYVYLLKSINYWCSVMNLNQEMIKKIKGEIELNKKEISDKTFFLSFDFIEGYDECNLIFRSNDKSMVCEFFFRRLL